MNIKKLKANESTSVAGGKVKRNLDIYGDGNYKVSYKVVDDSDENIVYQDQIQNLSTAFKIDNKCKKAMAMSPGNVGEETEKQWKEFKKNKSK